MISYKEVDNIKIATVTDCMIGSTADALDIMAEIFYQGCNRMIIPKEVLTDTFFKLMTGLAGDILQKFSNYNMKLAIVGDFESASGSLADFIYECNKGNQVFFKKTFEEAIAAFTGA